MSKELIREKDEQTKKDKPAEEQGDWQKEPIKKGDNFIPSATSVKYKNTISEGMCGRNTTSDKEQHPQIITDDF